MDNVNNISTELAYAAREYAKEREYWLNKLSGEIIKTNFPYDRWNGKALDGEEPGMESLAFNINGDLFSKLLKVSNNSDTRLFMVLAAGVALLLAKYTEHDDIIIGAPIYRQAIEGDFINTALALRVRLSADISFKELLIHVKEILVEAFENQNYPLETVPYELNIPFGEANDFPLFDTAVLLENIQEKSYLSHLKINILFSFFKEDDCITCTVEYIPYRYKPSTIEQIFERFKLLLEKCFAGPNTGISSLDILFDEEKRRLLNDFNNSGAGYPRDKTIHRLFEEQVERTPDNDALIEPITGTFTPPRAEAKHLTYKDLNEKANRLAHLLTARGIIGGSIVCVIGRCSPEIVIGILAVLKSGGTYLPLDSKNPPERNRFIIQDSRASLFLTQGDLINEQNSIFQGFSDREIIPVDDESIFTGEISNPVCNVNPENLAYIIYTSGTTGKPKGVMIPHRALVNYIWWAAGTYVKNETVHFPLFTSISFDLTVTSIFTPLITGNAIVVYTGNDGDHYEVLIDKILDDNRVGVVKLTPSHLYLIGDKKINGSQIKRFILGGELLETGITRKIYEYFKGNIEIYNEYGPTEATVGCMVHKFDSESDTGAAVPIGAPIANTQIYVLNRHLKPVPTGAVGEIYIGGEGLAAGYLKRAEFTSEKFISSPFNKGERLYRSGDMATWLQDGTIEFLGRIDNQIKIRGFRVEVNEIEVCLLKYENVKAAVVIPRKSPGKLSQESDMKDIALCAYFTADMHLPARQLREYLAQELPEYMIPSYFVQLEVIPLTPVGKVDKNALPDPEIKAEGEFAAPRDEIESKLVAMWADTLGGENEKIGIDDNYFELGGHSLKATLLAAQIHKGLNVKVPLSVIFGAPTVRELAKYIRNAPEIRFISLKPVEKKEYYSVSAVQKQIYAVCQLEIDTSYNTPQSLLLEGEFDLDRMERTFFSLIQRHEGLRTSFIVVDEKPVQWIHDNVKFEVERLSILGKEDETSIEHIVKKFIRPFDLSQVPLIRAGVIQLEKNKHILCIDLHHIITDGVSYDILMADFAAFYRGDNPPPLQVQYKDYSEWQDTREYRDILKKQESYWASQFADKIPGLKLPLDYPRSGIQASEGDVVTINIMQDLALKLNELIRQKKDTTLFMIMMATFTILLSRYSGQDDIVVGFPMVGRTHAELENIVGIFINMLALRTRPSWNKTFREYLDEVKISSRRAYENQDYPFVNLVELLRIPRDPGRNPIFDSVFSHQEISANQVEKTWLSSALKITPYKYGTEDSKFDLQLLSTFADGNFFMALEYKTSLFKRKTIESMQKHFIEILEQVVSNEEIKLGDISLSNDVVFGITTPEAGTVDFNF